MKKEMKRLRIIILVIAVLSVSITLLAMSGFINASMLNDSDVTVYNQDECIEKILEGYKVITLADGNYDFLSYRSNDKNLIEKGDYKLVGESRDGVIIKNFIKIANTNNITISNVTMTGSTPLVTYGVNNCRFEKIRFENTTEASTLIENSVGFTFEQCEFAFNKCNIMNAKNAQNIKFSNCKFINNQPNTSNQKVLIHIIDNAGDSGKSSIKFVGGCKFQRNILTGISNNEESVTITNDIIKRIKEPANYNCLGKLGATIVDSQRDLDVNVDLQSDLDTNTTDMQRDLDINNADLNSSIGTPFTELQSDDDLDIFHPGSHYNTDNTQSKSPHVQPVKQNDMSFNKINPLNNLQSNNIILPVPTYNQLNNGNNLCWATSSSMVISYFLKDTKDRTKEIAKTYYPSGDHNQIGNTNQMRESIKKYTKEDYSYKSSELPLEALKEELTKRPVVIRIEGSNYPKGHFMVVKGVNSNDSLVIIDPFKGNDSGEFPYENVKSNLKYRWTGTLN